MAYTSGQQWLCYYQGDPTTIKTWDPLIYKTITIAMAPRGALSVRIVSQSFSLIVRCVQSLIERMCMCALELVFTLIRLLIYTNFFIALTKHSAYTDKY